MKPYTFLLLPLIAVVLCTGCSDPLAGPALDAEPKAHTSPARGASKGAAEPLADLSVRLTVDTTPLFPPDTLVGLTIELHNAGPDVVPGVLVAFQAGADCVADDGDSDSGFDIIVWDFVGVQPGTRLTLDVACRVSGPGPVVSIAEVLASGARDPDSLPGNGDPDEDDYDSLTLDIGSGPPN